MQRGELARLAIEKFAVIVKALDAPQHHAPFDAASDRGAPVTGKGPRRAPSEVFGPCSIARWGVVGKRADSGCRATVNPPAFLLSRSLDRRWIRVRRTPKAREHRSGGGPNGPLPATCLVQNEASTRAPETRRSPP